MSETALRNRLLQAAQAGAAWQAAGAPKDKIPLDGLIQIFTIAVEICRDILAHYNDDRRLHPTYTLNNADRDLVEFAEQVKQVKASTSVRVQDWRAMGEKRVVDLQGKGEQAEERARKWERVLALLAEYDESMQEVESTVEQIGKK